MNTCWSKFGEKLSYHRGGWGHSCVHARTRKEALLHGLSSRLNDVEKRVERAKGSGETRHEDGLHRGRGEEERTRKDRLSRSSKREGGGRRKRKKEKRGGGKKKQRKEEGGLKIAARGSSHTGSRQDYIAESSLRKDHIAFVHRHPCHLTLHAFSVSFSI